ncbi:MAG: type II toxin-antitoxin system death-on-curing family toxin [Synergistaceae bacterium]|jgi:death-on-curing protein|nr:type II toxin-antitoxin system death-on-curing family toxin [Synergistaceae bacterium]
MTQSKPLFLPLSKILELHERQIQLYGGEPSIRDMGLLESAVAMPISGFGDYYLHAFPFEMAAAYLYHIVQNHPFVDGNKRTGAVASLVFLKMHGIEIDMPEDIFEQFVWSVATGQVLKPEIAAFLEKYSRPSS